MARSRSLVGDVTLFGSCTDALAWSFCLKGLFTVSSFRRCMEESTHLNSLDVKTMWQGTNPPKVELFVWKLLRGRIMVREVLHHFGVSRAVAQRLAPRRHRTSELRSPAPPKASSRCGDNPLAGGGEQRALGLGWCGPSVWGGGRSVVVLVDQ
ncbi:hypothetical protein Dsin_025634 [Dipteronia sinensis]|uniref:Reverse transcriptase zinc-binding domain-containing protein n=1 Tax=Dipteronia sinensis TaxID=43782 RepID=A0AAD9ZXB3_9ROSI|nr:hypothetical protein Dsin_025634 [Dipteronia sinensis]